jgi:predicted flap endonuclease-1-like 5' DNA nuclease
MRVATDKLRGITLDLASKLKAKGLGHSDQLLEAAKTPAARHDLAKAMGITDAGLLELANRADLARIKGIGKVFSDLLENAGVDTVKELSHRVPANLHAKLVEINNEKKLSGRQPTLEMVQDWIAQAKELPKAIEY